METKLLPLLARHQGLKVTVEHATTAEILDVVRATLRASRRRSRPITSSSTAPRSSRAVCDRTCIACRWPSASGIASPCARRRPPARPASTSAPIRRRIRSGKESACGCAGVFCGPTALQTYVQVFDEEGALDKFEGFASLNGARFHGLEPNAETITLERRPGRALACVAVDETEVVVFRGDGPFPGRSGANDHGGRGWNHRARRGSPLCRHTRAGDVLRGGDARLSRPDRALNPTFNAIVALRDEAELMAEAAQADAKLARGEPVGLLHGFPLAVKDLDPVRGLPSRKARRSSRSASRRPIRSWSRACARPGRSSSARPTSPNSGSARTASIRSSGSPATPTIRPRPAAGRAAARRGRRPADAAGGGRHRPWRIAA